MFDSISQRYDFLNKILTFGQDGCWRDKLIQNIYLKNGDKILDICTGTGDLVIKLAKKFPEIEIYALGKLIFGNSKAYSYLRGSIARFFDRDELEAILVSKGFIKEKIISLMFGAILLSVFKKFINGV